MKTTLAEIRAYDLGVDEWEKLLAHLGKTKADHEPLSIITILDSNGLRDALYCLSEVGRHRREVRLYFAWCAKHVRHLMTDIRCIAALDAMERFANGEMSAAEFAACRDAAQMVPPASGVHGEANQAARCAVAITKVPHMRGLAGSFGAETAECAAQAAYWEAREKAGADAATAAKAAAREAQANELRRVCAAIDAGVDPYPRKGTNE